MKVFTGGGLLAPRPIRFWARFFLDFSAPSEPFGSLGTCPSDSDAGDISGMRTRQAVGLTLGVLQGFLGWNMGRLVWCHPRCRV